MGKSFDHQAKDRCLASGGNKRGQQRTVFFTNEEWLSKFAHKPLELNLFLKITERNIVLSFFMGKSFDHQAKDRCLALGGNKRGQQRTEFFTNEEWLSKFAHKAFGTKFVP